LAAVQEFLSATPSLLTSKSTPLCALVRLKPLPEVSATIGEFGGLLQVRAD
jgi:hypothetical protein